MSRVKRIMSWERRDHIYLLVPVRPVSWIPLPVWLDLRKCREGPGPSFHLELSVYRSKHCSINQSINQSINHKSINQIGFKQIRTNLKNWETSKTLPSSQEANYLSNQLATVLAVSNGARPQVSSLMEVQDLNTLTENKEIMTGLFFTIELQKFNPGKKGTFNLDWLIVCLLDWLIDWLIDWLNITLFQTVSLL